jgi:glycosyltransferase involved in cell wall biosynthesis
MTRPFLSINSNRRRRVLFFEHNVDGTVGGSHYCMLELCRALDRARFEPVACFAQKNSLLEEFCRAGAEVLVIEPSRTVLLDSGNPLLRLLLRPAQSIANLFRTLVWDSFSWVRRLRGLRIDLVHLNNSSGGDHDLIAAALFCGIPAVAHQRGYPTGVGKLERWFAHRLDAIIAISTSVREDLATKGISGEKVVLIHDGIDAGRVIASAEGEDMRSRLGIAPSAFLVGVVGNIKAWKGQDTLVRAMGKVRHFFPETFCLVVGSVADEPYFALMRQHVSELNLEDRVIFTGYERYPARCMLAMDVVVHTSTAPEPFGLVVLEGMALGKPVVATGHGGPLDVIEMEISGFLTPPGDDTALGDVICRLLGNAQLRVRVGTAGRDRMLANFTARQNVEAVQGLYDRLFAAKGR